MIRLAIAGAALVAATACNPLQLGHQLGHQSGPVAGPTAPAPAPSSSPTFMRCPRVPSSCHPF